MWVEEMNSTIYSLIRGNTKEDISADYPNVFYTNDNENMSKTKFPCIYIHPIGTTETDSDLESTDINSAIFTQEVQVTFNSDYEVDDLYTVLGFISREFKALRFQMVTNSTPYSNNGLKSISARYRRTIANGDKL